MSAVTRAAATRRSPSADLKEVLPREPGVPFTAADVPALLDRLGGIDPARVRLSPAPGTATAEDAEWFHDHTDQLYELIEGTLVEKVASDWSSYLSLEIGALLRAFVKPRKLGVMHGADGFFHFGDDLRGPDCSFTPKSRRTGPLLRRGYSDLPPALVVEVLSPGNTRREMDRKRATSFAHGVDRVWEVDEDADGPLVRVHDAADTFITLRSGDTLTGDPVLPGFAVAVDELFVDPLADTEPADAEPADAESADAESGEEAPGG